MLVPELQPCRFHNFSQQLSTKQDPSASMCRALYSCVYGEIKHENIYHIRD